MVLSSNWAYPASKLWSEDPPPSHRERRTTDPTGDPFTAADLRAFARLDDYDDDANLTAAIKAAVSFVERELCIALLPQTWTATIEGAFPLGGYIPQRRPFGAITSITTVRHDADDEAWVTGDYLVRPGGVVSALNSERKRLGEHDWVSLVYTAGWANAAAIPSSLLHALKIIAHEYAVWARDVGGEPPAGWPGMSWPLARDYQTFRGV
jgi:uncharacterized phiE125 gp8 family phage protein